MPSGRNDAYWERRRVAARNRYAKKKDDPEFKASRSEYGKQWYANNKERRAAVGRAWLDANPEKAREIQRRNRARRRGAVNEFVPGEWEEMVAYADNKCLCCGASPVTQDHVVPLSKGGAHSPFNTQPLCGTCNDKKGTDDTDYRPDDWPWLTSSPRRGQPVSGRRRVPEQGCPGGVGPCPHGVPADGYCHYCTTSYGGALRTDKPYTTKGV